MVWLGFEPEAAGDKGLKEQMNPLICGGNPLPVNATQNSAQSLYSETTCDEIVTILWRNLKSLYSETTCDEILPR